jgi:predicted RNA-binding Zn-ribbon protein involved in translation (DUF1610 family)
MMNEHYKITCYSCNNTVTVPPHDGKQACPLCGAVLRIEWNADQRVAGRAAQ